MSHAARRVCALRNRTKSVTARPKLKEKDVYGADARSEQSQRPYKMFDGVAPYRPVVFGFVRNEVNHLRGAVK